MHNKAGHRLRQEANDTRARLRALAALHGVELAGTSSTCPTPAPSPASCAPLPSCAEIATTSTRTRRTPARPRKQTQRQKRAALKRRREAQRRADAAADARTEERLWQVLESYGYETRTLPGGGTVRVARGATYPVVPRAVHRMVGAIVSDPSGASARRWFRRTKLRAFSALVRDVAIASSTEHATFRCIRARRVVALGALLEGCARRTNRKGRWRWLVEGIPLSLIQWMLRDPWAKAERRGDPGVPSRGALTGTYGWAGRWDAAPAGQRSGSRRVGCGILTALRQHGAAYSPDNAGLPYKYVTRTGYQPNQYWLLTDVAEHAPGSSLDVLRALAAVVDDRREPEAPPRFHSTGPP